MVDNTTMIVGLPFIDYDTNGAMIYIIVVLLCYSIGIVFLLGMQMLAHTDEIEDPARLRTRFLIRNLRDLTNTKQILEELVDKQNRDRLWDIYLGTTLDTKNRLTRAENMRIRHIEKQLAAIKRNHRFTHDTLVPSTNTIRFIRTRLEYRPDTLELPSEATSTHRRRSSLDQQTLERWTELANQSKPVEQLPWTIRKLMIRRYFRRHTKKSTSKHSRSIIPIINNEQMDRLISSNHIPTLSHSRTELDLRTITSTIDERQNPYLSYFSILCDRPMTIPSLFLPLNDH